MNRLFLSMLTIALCGCGIHRATEADIARWHDHALILQASI